MIAATVCKFCRLMRESVLGDLQIFLVDEKKVEIPLKIIEIENGVYVMEYVPMQPGVYTLTALYGDLVIPQSPLKIQVVPHADVSKIKVEGLERSKFHYVLTIFFI